MGHPPLPALSLGSMAAGADRAKYLAAGFGLAITSGRVLLR